MKEATARIKINKLLETAGWRFFSDENGPANIVLEPGVALVSKDLDEVGEEFEKSSKGFVDFLLLDTKGFPLIVLEAKKGDLHPLVGKEQARDYAKSQKCRFVILSNGDQHYFWDLERGNPDVITAFPTPDSVTGYKKTQPDPQHLIEEAVKDDYIVLTQRPGYASEAAWKNPDERADFVAANKLRFLRPYQKEAIEKLQAAAKEGKDRFLFEMATGTGKTLTAAAIIKLFLSSGNARRVLFLVDRLELEDQAKKAFGALLSNDYKTVIFKENQDDWRHAEIVVSTVQSLLFNNKYQALFSPTDFDLVISDEAHRSIGGNSRAVFEFFVGYKMGLTATPRDYLKNFDPAPPISKDPREHERRMLLDTYRTFGCENSEPTFHYSLLDGVRDGFLINPTVVDARTQVTTELLSEEGFVVDFKDGEGEDQQQVFKQSEFERRFFAEGTNELFCKTFLEKALRDPVTGEIGKSIVFSVSQRHAAKLAQIFNVIADKMFPGKYQSDFAVQVTSQIKDAQQFTINFANNNLLGSANFDDAYKTSKARVCVTVGMMTTGYDCPDILNLGLFRPIFSPTDFIQIKGRGTRKHNFLEQVFDDDLRASVDKPEKSAFKLFDFFANCEYFERDFQYDEVLQLPQLPSQSAANVNAAPGAGPVIVGGNYEHLGADILASVEEQPIGKEGMKIDRKFFEKFEQRVRADEFVADSVREQQWERAVDYINREVLSRKDNPFTLELLRRAAAVDRPLSMREILQKTFDFIPEFKSKDELLEEEFAKFLADSPLSGDDVAATRALKNFFKAYATSAQVRQIIDGKRVIELATNPTFSTNDYRAVPLDYRTRIPQYINDYVPVSQFSL